MKKRFILILGLLVITHGYAQLLEGLNQISPLTEGLSAIEKEGKWAFVDTEGQIVIDFRDDLVVETSKHLAVNGIQEAGGSFPRFFEGRCLIHETREGIKYFGFIDKKGKTVVNPQYVNAKVYSMGHAIVTQYSKKVVGKNQVLGKDVVAHQIEDLVLDKSGKIVTSLLNARNIVPDKLKSGDPPPINAVVLSENTAAVKTEDSTWSMYKF